MIAKKTEEVAGKLYRFRLLNRPLLAALSMMLLTCADASALMVPLGTTTLVDQASCIVEGRVTKLSCRWTDDHSAIVTEAVIQTTEVLLGETNQVRISLLGGVVDNLEQRVSDMPKLTNGQQVLVFLRSPAPEEAQRDLPGAKRGRSYALVGAAQGLYRIEGTRANKDGFAIVGDPSVIDRNLDVTELKARIRQRLATLRQEGGVR
jgi:hypothetical protein